MFNKKLGCILLILLMATSLLAGCSPAEKGYYDLISATNRLKTYQFSGNMELDVVQLPVDVFKGSAVNQGAIIKALDNHRLEYDGMVDKNKQILTYNFALADNTTGLKTKILSLIYQNGVLYVQVQDLLNYLKMFSDSNQAQQLAETFSGVEWVSLNSQEIASLMSAEGQQIKPNDLFAMSLSQQTAWQRLMDALVNDAYAGFQSGLVTQSSGQYTLTVKGSKVVGAIQSLTQYSIQNFDQVATSLKKFLQSLTPAEMASLGLTGQSQAEALQAIDSLAALIKYNREEYLAQVSSDLVTSSADLGMLNDSELVSTIAKVDGKTYLNSGRLHLDITGNNPADRLEMTINMQNTIKAESAVQVTQPTVGVVSWSDLNQRLSRQMAVSVDTGNYTLNNGFYTSRGNVNVQVISGRSYLPLRKVAESLGEKVGWDSAWNQPYVDRDGQRIYMTGLLINDRAYIKMMDFERLGYQITWSDYSRTVTITK